MTMTAEQVAECRTMILALADEVDRLRDLLGAEVTECARRETRATIAENRVDRLRIALMRDHANGCSVPQSGECDCGHTESPAQSLADARAMAEIAAKSNEQIDAELREAGVDIEGGVARTHALVRVSLERNRAIRERDAARALLREARGLLDECGLIEPDYDAVDRCKARIDEAMRTYEGGPRPAP